MNLLNLKYSNKVVITKFVILLIISIILIAVISFPIINKSNEDFRISFKSVTKDKSDNPTMIEPNFVGIDEKDNTYNIRAKKAIKIDKNNVIFEQVNANLLFGNDKIVIESGSGEFDNISKLLHLADKVNITNDNNLLSSDKFKIDTRNGIITSESKVQATGDLGTLSSDSMKIIENDKYIAFIGNVKMTINLDDL